MSVLKNKMFKYIGAVLLLLAGIFMFLAVPFSNVIDAGKTLIDLGTVLKLGIGAILGGIFTILAGCVLAFDGYAIT